MENKEENLKKAFNYIKIFYREVSQMLKDTEELMDKERWGPEGDTSVTASLSYSLENPDRWVVQYLYRNFINKQKEGYMKSILVLFDEENNKFPMSIVCGNVNISDKKYHKWDSWSLLENNKDKLKNLTCEVVQVKAESKERKITGKLFAIPLTEIKSREDLKGKVIDRLLRLD